MNSKPDPARRAYWLKTLHRWHWISSALCLVGMLIFAATGITLNHAASIESSPRVESRMAELPPALQAQVEAMAADITQKTPLPPALRAWLSQQLDIDTGDRLAE